MKCAKCGKEIKNLPEYFSAIHTEILCRECTEYQKQEDSPVSLLLGLKKDIPKEILPDVINNIDEAA
jgi:hypothetical protein